jgi:hypothetical protein
VGGHQGREGPRHLGVDRRGSAGFLGLQPLPVRVHLVGGVRPDVGEHVGVTADQLLHGALGNIVDVEGLLVGCQLGVEHGLEQDVAELVPEPDRVAVLDGVEELVRLVEQVAAEASMGLGPVPRTAVGGPEPGHHADQVEEPPAGPAGGDGTGRNVVQRIGGGVEVGTHARIVRG